MRWYNGKLYLTCEAIYSMRYRWMAYLVNRWAIACVDAGWAEYRVDLRMIG